MATGIAHRLFTCGFTSILMSEAPEPLAVRRGVAFCEAVWEGSMTVEGVRAEHIDDFIGCRRCLGRRSDSGAGR